jgi:hypothetical protein
MSTTSLTTFAEFELLPEIAGKRELLDGEVTVSPARVLLAMSGFTFEH